MRWQWRVRAAAAMHPMMTNRLRSSIELTRMIDHRFIWCCCWFFRFFNTSNNPYDGLLSAASTIAGLKHTKYSLMIWFWFVFVFFRRRQWIDLAGFDACFSSCEVIETTQTHKYWFDSQIRTALSDRVGGGGSTYEQPSQRSQYFDFFKACTCCCLNRFDSILCWFSNSIRLMRRNQRHSMICISRSTLLGARLAKMTTMLQCLWYRVISLFSFFYVNTQ